MNTQAGDNEIGDPESILKAFRKLKKKQPKKNTITKFDIVKNAIDDILEMQGRGFTLSEIAETFVEAGLQIDESTLKSYIHRTKASLPKSHPARAPRASSKKVAAAEAAAPVADEKASKGGGFDVKKDSEDL